MTYKYFLLFLVLVVLFNCKKSTSQPRQIIIPISEVIEKPLSSKLEFDSLKLGINFKPKDEYQKVIATIKRDKNFFKQLYSNNKKHATDSASTYIASKLLNDIAPHWYGTTWDFNGYTNNPNDGVIACGYFVSTTLKHLGFNLNRYKMAQQAGMNEALALQSKSNLEIFRNLSFGELKNKLNEIYSDGIYFVGLDNHVGYVYIKDKEIYFLHSSYCDNKVVIEKAETSYCFSSNIYVFAEISTNKDLIKKWILDEKLTIIKN